MPTPATAPPRTGDGRDRGRLGPVRGIARRASEAARAIRGAGARAVAGDRPLAVAVLVILIVALATLSGPFQHFLDARERVESLRAKTSALESANTELEQRARDLTDPEHIELLAREQHGLIRPGEIPYVIVPPETDRPRITTPVQAPAPEQPWYRRVWNTIRDVVG